MRAARALPNRGKLCITKLILRFKNLLFQKTQTEKQDNEEMVNYENERIIYFVKKEKKKRDEMKEEGGGK